MKKQKEKIIFSCRDDALVEISHEKNPAGRIRLLASLNPDAQNGPQIEEYTEKWTLEDLEAVRKNMLKRKDFYCGFNEVNGNESGGISLIDDVSNDFLAKYFSDGESTEMRMEEFAELLPVLPDGAYHVF